MKFNAVKNTLYRFRHLIVIMTIIAIVSGLFVWVYWYNLSADLSELSEREYINDNYNVLTQDLTAEGMIVQPFTTDTPIYGATFVFHTYGSTVNGTLSVELYNAEELLSFATIDMSVLLDNTHHAVMFDHPVFPQEGDDLKFVITASPTTEEDRLALWRSENSVDLAPLTQNSQTVDATLGFGIITNRGDNSVLVLAIILFLLTCVVAVGAYLMIFVFKLSLPVITALLVFGIGIIYILVFPPHAAPDEEVHIHTAYYYSNNLLGVPNESGLTMRSGDVIEIKSAAELDIFSYQQVISELFRRSKDNTLVSNQSRLSLSEPFWIYAPTTLGVTLGRLLGFNYITLIFFGRLFNLAVFALVMAFSVYFMPKYKQMLLLIALLPSCIHLAASFSYDSVVIGLSALFISICLDSAHKNAPIGKVRIAALSIIGFLFAPMKAIYIFIVGFCRIIPPGLFKNKKSYYLSLSAILGASFFSWAARFSPMTVFATTWEDVSDVAEPVVDYVEREFYDLGYILSHLQDTIKVFFATLQENSWLYLSQMVGGEMGEPILSDIFIFEPLVVVMLLLLCLSVAMRQKETPLLSPFQKSISIICMLFVIAVLTYVMLSWTPRHHDTIWGLQGRYLLPLLPLILLSLQNGFLTVKNDIARPLVMAMTGCSLIAAVNVFQEVVGVLG